MHKIQYTLCSESIFLSSETFESKLGHSAPLPFSTLVYISYVKESSWYIRQNLEVNNDSTLPLSQRYYSGLAICPTVFFLIDTGSSPAIHLVLMSLVFFNPRTLSLVCISPHTLAFLNTSVDL